MSANVSKRIEALERAGTAGIDFILILRRIVKPGVQSGEATHATVLGQHFEREPAEPEVDFIERVRAFGLAHRRPGQRCVQVLMDETDLDL
jgi:hypothetical protein